MNNILIEIAEKLRGIDWDNYTKAEHDIIKILIREGTVTMFVDDNGQPAFKITE